MPSSLEVEIDPRIELLGVVQYLAGLRRPGGGAPAEDPVLESRFARWRAHPVVGLYRVQVEKNGGEESHALIVLFLTAPPELGWARDRRLVSADFIAQAGGARELERFLSALRAFAEVSDFRGFFAENRARFERHRRQGVKSLAGRDYLGILEEYVGERLDSRCRVLWSLYFTRGRLNSFIIPYPYQGPGRIASGPFEIYTIPNHGEQRALWPDYIWEEALYVPLERLWAERHRDVEGLPADAKALLVAALNLRLTRAHLWRDDAPADGDLRARTHPLTWALYRRLEDYEGDRGRYGTLRAFLPRLLDVFRRAGSGSPKPC
jgi:hypothetical protein